MTPSPGARRLIHDFKNQLGIILGFSQMLVAETADTDPRKSDLQEIHRAANAAMELLAQLRALLPEEQP